jgi:hypothetical protein
MSGGAMAELPTIKIEADTELGYIIINQDDFDPKEHTPIEMAKSKEGKVKSRLPDLMRLSNKDLAAWGRETLGLDDMNGRTARSALMKRINAALAAQRDG